MIMDDELLQCLSALPMLENTFLQGIKLRPDGTSLIPKMHFLSLSSLHRFTDGTYWDFVSSRVVAARNGEIGCSILSSDASAVAYEDVSVSFLISGGRQCLEDRDSEDDSCSKLYRPGQVLRWNSFLLQ
jgi:hypothetical protein